MTNSTHALFLTGLTVVALCLAAAVGATVVGHPHVVTGGALALETVSLDGSPSLQRQVLWSGGAAERARDMR